MRILQAIPSMDPTGGGTTEGVVQQSIALKNLGHTVEVVCSDDPNENFLTSYPLRIHAMGPASGKFCYTPKLIPWLMSNAAAFDIVIVNGLWQYNSFAVHKAMKRLKRPYIVFTHGMLSPWFKKEYPLKHLKKWLYWPWADFRVLRDANAVLFTCDEERILAKQSFWLYRANEVVANYGTAGPVGNRECQLQALYAEYPDLIHAPMLLYLSRIHPVKGCDLLIKAFAKVSASNPSIRLVMAGPDQTGWKGELERLAESLGISGRIVWTGMLSGDLKWGAYFACDAFVLPSHQENFGIVVAEALACGRPVLISNKVNIWREIEAAGAGIVDEDTQVGATAMLETWLNLPREAREHMAERARQCFLDHFEIEKSAQTLLAILEKYVLPKS